MVWVMYTDNVIWVDFRLSKDIRAHQKSPFAERIAAHSARTQEHLQASKSAIEIIKMMVERERAKER